MADSIPRVCRIGVAAVLAPLLRQGFQIRQHVAPCYSEHGTDYRPLFERQHRMNPGQATGSGAAQKPQQNSFCLVIAGMSGADLVESVFPQQSRKELVTKLSCRRFQA
jgi:hypothetical protein